VAQQQLQTDKYPIGDISSSVIRVKKYPNLEVLGPSFAKIGDKIKSGGYEQYMGKQQGTKLVLSPKSVFI
jgi:hypothetical protein